MNKEKLGLEKQFVTYEIALKLKELGFDEECLAGFGDIYSITKPNYIDTFEEIKCFPILIGEDVSIKSRFGYYSIQCKAPLWQQAQLFLDSKGVIIGMIFANNVFKYTLNIENYVSDEFEDRMSAIKSATKHATSYLWNQKFSKQ